MIICVVVNKYDGKIFTTTKNKVPTDLSKPKYMSHAEYFAIKMLKKHNKNINDYMFIISFNPCNGCVRMFDMHEIKKVYVVAEKNFIADEYERTGFSHEVLPKEKEAHEEVYNRVIDNIRGFMKEEYN